ncbi:MAG: hypothetical protein ACRDJN_32515, partial [Chloroflexota bacterium]
MAGVHERSGSRGRTRRQAFGIAAGTTGMAGAALLAACGPAGGGSGDAAPATKAREPVNLSTNIQSPASTQWAAYD